MNQDLVYRSNVLFELYKATLSGEISRDEFVKVSKIVKRARAIPVEEVIATEEALRRYGHDRD